MKFSKYFTIIALLLLTSIGHANWFTMTNDTSKANDTSSTVLIPVMARSHITEAYISSSTDSSFSTAIFVLDGSIDGVKFYPMDTLTFSATQLTAKQGMIWTNNKPVRYIRHRLISIYNSDTGAVCSASVRYNYAE